MTRIYVSYDVGNPKVWRQEREYRRIIKLDDGRTFDITVPANFEWDGASIPRFARSWLGRWGRYSGASLIHDYLYENRIGTRAEADALFLRLMKEDGVGWARRNIMYAAVRAGGWRAWAD